MEGGGVSCSRVFSCAFSAQVPLVALRPSMGVCGGAGQRGADLCPPVTRAHGGLFHLLRAARHVRGKGARCVRVPCLLMHQHAVMCALSCSPLPAPPLPFPLSVCSMCMSMCVHGCMGVCMRVYVCVRMCHCVFSYHLSSPRLRSPLLPFPFLLSPPLSSPRLLLPWRASSLLP